MGRQREECVVTTEPSFDGFGAMFANNWLAGRWINNCPPRNLIHQGFRNFVPAPDISGELLHNVNYLELIAACVAIFTWAPFFQGGKVTIVSDNSSTELYLRKCTTKTRRRLDGYGEL